MEVRNHNQGDTNSLLEVSDLSIGINRTNGVLPLTDRVSFHLNQGEVLGLIGESGCGKSITSLAVMGMLPEPGGKLLSGKIQFLEHDILSLDESGLNQLRSQKISMIFQEPFAAMNPLIRIGDQMREVFDYHPVAFDKHQKIKHLLDEVGLTDHPRILQSYPHELSGGMLQRIMIAMSLLLDPDLLIADEPTTALDVTVQAQIMNLIVRLKRERKMSVLLISHNISLMAQYTDRIAVMYAGQIVESNHTESFLKEPKHPYSQGLMHAIPTLDQQQRKIISIPGQVPEPGKYQQGCRFESRCIHATDICQSDPPDKTADKEGSYRCHY
jgi:peptide/nickel transport system ATP-binding protein